VQNLEEKERKLRQTRSNFRTGNSDLDGKHLPERCSNSFRLGLRITTGTTYRPQNVYRNGVPAPLYTTALGCGNAMGRWGSCPANCGIGMANYTFWPTNVS